MEFTHQETGYYIRIESSQPAKNSALCYRSLTVAARKRWLSRDREGAVWWGRLSACGGLSGRHVQPEDQTRRVDHSPMQAKSLLYKSISILRRNSRAGFQPAVWKRRGLDY